jgi:hypothetical protein
MREWSVPGLSLAVVVNGETRVRREEGRCDGAGAG